MNRGFYEESKEEVPPRASFSQIFRRPSHQTTAPAPSRAHRVLSVFSRTYAAEPNEIPRSSSMPSSSTDFADAQDVKRSASGGILFFRGITRKQRSIIEQEFHMRTRAKDMCAIFEMSDEKPTDLHKMHKVNTATTVVGPPRFSAHLSDKQALEKFVNKEASCLQSLAVNPLMTDRERKKVKEKAALMEKRLDKVEVDSNKDAARLEMLNELERTLAEEEESELEMILEYDSLLKDRGQKQAEQGAVRLEWSGRTRSKSDFETVRKPPISQLSLWELSRKRSGDSATAFTMAKEPLSDMTKRGSWEKTTKGIEDIPKPLSPGSYSVALTEPNTPSPKGGGSLIVPFHESITLSPEGRLPLTVPFYDLPDVC